MLLNCFGLIRGSCIAQYLGKSQSAAARTSQNDAPPEASSCSRHKLDPWKTSSRSGPQAFHLRRSPIRGAVRINKHPYPSPLARLTRCFHHPHAVGLGAVRAPTAVGDAHVLHLHKHKKERRQCQRCSIKFAKVFLHDNPTVCASVRWPNRADRRDGRSGRVDNHPFRASRVPCTRLSSTIRPIKRYKFRLSHAHSCA